MANDDQTSLELSIFMMAQILRPDRQLPPPQTFHPVAGSRMISSGLIGSRGERRFGEDLFLSRLGLFDGIRPPDPLADQFAGLDIVAAERFPDCGIRRNRTGTAGMQAAMAGRTVKLRVLVQRRCPYRQDRDEYDFFLI